MGFQRIAQIRSTLCDNHSEMFEKETTILVDWKKAYTERERTFDTTFKEIGETQKWKEKVNENQFV